MPGLSDLIPDDYEPTDEDRELFKVLAIRYGIFVHSDKSLSDRLREQRCNYEGIDCYPKDLQTRAALEENYYLQQKNASVEYDSSEIVDLTVQAPNLYEGSTDSSVFLDQDMRDYFHAIVGEVNRRIAEFFGVSEEVRVEYTYELYSQLPEEGVHSPSYEARALSGVAYVSPLVVRAPFFMCYESGVKSFIKSKSILQFADVDRLTDDDMVAFFEGLNHLIESTGYAFGNSQSSSWRMSLCMLIEMMRPFWSNKGRAVCRLYCVTCRWSVRICL